MKNGVIRLAFLLVIIGLTAGLWVVIAMASESDYVYNVNYEQAIIARYKGDAADLTIPYQLGGYPVVEIDAGAFRNCTSTVPKLKII